MKALLRNRFVSLTRAGWVALLGVFCLFSARAADDTYLAFKVGIYGSFVAPTIAITNNSRGIQITNIVINVGNPAVIWDAIYATTAPEYGTISATVPDTDDVGGTASFSIVANVTSFDPGDYIIIRADLDFFGQFSSQ